jgi:hypothetical protein
LTHPEIFSGKIPADTVARLDPGYGSVGRPEQLADFFLPYPGTGG